jgi:hypothetical protein
MSDDLPVENAYNEEKTEDQKVLEDKITRITAILNEEPPAAIVSTLRLHQDEAVMAGPVKILLLKKKENATDTESKGPDTEGNGDGSEPAGAN